MHSQETNAEERKKNATYRVDDIVRIECDVLDAGSSVVVYVFLDLTFAFPRGGFIDGHFHRLVPVGHHDRAQRRILCVNLSGTNAGIFAGMTVRRVRYTCRYNGRYKIATKATVSGLE